MHALLRPDGQLNGGPARLTIEPVRTRAQLSEFITLPRRLYDGMPGYSPPLDFERRLLLDPKYSAFFRRGYARYWIAREGARALGRVSAQIDLAAEGPDADAIGLFGCLDAIDDADVVAGLLHTAENWLHRHQRRLARGPFQLSINDESGLLIEGHAEPPMIMLPWHPPYLDGLVRRAGYAPAMRLFTFHHDVLGYSADQKLQELAALRERAGIAVRNLDPRDIPGDIEQMRRMFNDAWRSNWGFTPFTESDAASLAREFRPLLFPDMVFFIELRGKPAGFVLTIPNVAEIAADLSPRPGLLGWLKLLVRIKRARYRSCRLALLGIDSSHRSSVLGGLIATVAFAEVQRAGRARGYEYGSVGWVLETNKPLLAGIEAFGCRRERT
jgi:hypothetical protein